MRLVRILEKSVSPQTIEESVEELKMLTGELKDLYDLEGQSGA